MSDELAHQLATHLANNCRQLRESRGLSQAQMARAAGRDPSSLKLIVRANLDITERPLGDQRSIFTGTLAQIREDVEGCRAIGPDEIYFDPTFMPGAHSVVQEAG